MLLARGDSCGLASGAGTPIAAFFSIVTAAAVVPEPQPPLRRRYWLLPCAALVVLPAYGFLHFASKTFTFENTGDAVYTSWVYNPLIGSLALTAVLGVVASGLLLMRRWRTVTRNAMVAVVAAFALVAIPLGLDAESVRRHIAPSVLRAVEAVPAPPGATEVGRASVYTDEDALEILQEPQAARSWRTATGSKADACEAVHAVVAGDERWRQWSGSCGFVRSVGLVDVYLEVGTEAGNVDRWQIIASAMPRDR